MDRRERTQPNRYSKDQFECCNHSRAEHGAGDGRLGDPCFADHDDDCDDGSISDVGCECTDGCKCSGYMEAE